MRGIQHRAIQTCPQCAREFFWAPAAGLCPYCDLSHNARITNLDNGSPDPEPCGPACCPIKGERMTNIVATGRLKELEATIEKSAKAVWDMAQALKEIHDDDLWKETHGTWGEYCEGRWNIGRSWALATIQAVEVRKQLTAGGVRSSGRLHVKQASVLARVPEVDRPRVWEKAMEKAQRDGKDEPSLHRHLTPAMQEYRAEQVAPSRDPTPADRAHDAARDMRRAAEGFATTVDLLIPHLTHLTEDEAQGCAYKIVETVHAVIATLQEHGYLKDSVARGVLGGTAPATGREIHVA